MHSLIVGDRVMIGFVFLPSAQIMPGFNRFGYYCFLHGYLARPRRWGCTYLTHSHPRLVIFILLFFPLLHMSLRVPMQRCGDVRPWLANMMQKEVG